MIDLAEIQVLVDRVRAQVEDDTAQLRQARAEVARMASRLLQSELRLKNALKLQRKAQQLLAQLH